MKAYDELMAYQHETEALAQVAGGLGWDQETMMPHGAAALRGEQMGAMEAVLHARRTDARLGAWLAKIDDANLGEVARAQMCHIRHDYARNIKVPAELAAEIARVTSVAQGQWAEARAAEDVSAFLPVLENIVRLRREEASALSTGGALYDALIDDYEPGMTAERLTAMFARLRPRLVALRERVLGAERRAPELDAEFPRDGQMALARELAGAFGYDWNRGRLDLSVHPFTSGAGTDVRITTRVAERDPFNCIYSTIHETGHAAYEQAIAPEYALTPLGSGVSMGVHESQSRICENQLGRSRAFTGWLFARMRARFGDFGIGDADAFYAAVNRVAPGYIRTEADEVNYNLHILLRFDLERELIGGTLEVADLEAAWNARFAADFGVTVDKPSHGVLQDVHWSAGLFGYFPTYTLGNVYSGYLARALRRDIPDLDAQFAQGKPGAAMAWLGEKVQRFGGVYEPAEVITRACGEAMSEAPLLDYLEVKFGEIYRL